LNQTEVLGQLELLYAMAPTTAELEERNENCK